MHRLATFFGPARLAGLAVMACLLALRIVDPAPVQQLRFAAFDLFQQIKPRTPQPVPVTILDIDDQSLESVGQWPWPRSTIADLVALTFEGGAVALAFDVVFSEPDRTSPAELARANPDLPADVRMALEGLPDNDARLADMIGRTRVILGQTSVRSTRAGLAGDEADGDGVATPHAIMGEDPRAFLQQFPDLVENLPELEAVAAGRGIFSVRPDSDGIYRRVPVVMVVDGSLRLGLAPELLRVATGGNAFVLRGNAAGADGVVLGGQLVRTAGDGTVWPHLTPSQPDRFVSAGDLLDGSVPPGRLSGQLVLLGTTAIGLEDFRPTALGVSMAGVEIHAQLLENILTGTLLNRPNYFPAVELAVLLSLSLLVIGLVPVIGARWIIVFSVLILAGYLGVTWLLFSNQRTLLDPTWPTLGTLVTLMVMSTANYLREERERRQIRGAFGQYVSPALVEKLSDDPEALTLGGERRALTLLFSDVRGFTTLAEGYRDDPSGLTHLMNDFLTALSNEILAEGGTIDKYMGDAVMAFWNAPLPTDNHQAAACRAALAMQRAVGELNAKRAAEAAAEGTTSPEISVGIGLNSGTCTVGNMGSDTRFDYTALGDPVNLASRLEGQSKTYGVDIVIGQTTATAVAGQFALLDLDLLRVKGKTTPERIFALVGDKVMQESAGFKTVDAANTAMREAYAKQDWEGAATALKDLTAAGPDAGLDLSGYVALYEDRIAMLRQHPPGPDWDAVHTATDK